MNSCIRLLLIVLSIIWLNCSNSGKTREQINAIRDTIANSTISLINQAHFKGHTSLWDGSSFLINYKNKTYAVTAKHMLGMAGGVEPKINPNDLSGVFVKWLLYPRNNVLMDTVYLKNSDFNYDELDSDIILIEVDSIKGNIKILEPNFEIPEEDENLFIVGCPFSDKDCFQNIYSADFISYNPPSKLLVGIMKDSVDVPGLSGAPVIDMNGKVVGLVTTNWKEDGYQYVGATFIGEIERIKFK